MVATPPARRRPATPAAPSTADAPDLLDDSLGYALKRAQVRAYDLMFQCLGPEALSPGRMTALSLIGGQPGISQSALAEQLKVNRASVVKVIDTLEALGFVERRATAGDRRSHALVLTAAGEDELQTLHGQIRRYEQALAENLSAEERQQLLALLERVAPAEGR